MKFPAVINVGGKYFSYDIYPNDDFGRCKVEYDAKGELNPFEVVFSIDPHYCYLRDADGAKLGQFKLDGAGYWFYEGEDGTSYHPGLKHLSETEVVVLRIILEKKYAKG